MSNRPLLIITNVLLATPWAVAGDVLRIDSVDAEISASIQSTCPGGDQYYGDSAADFAAFPIEIAADATCGLPGGASVRTDGALTEDGFTVTAYTSVGAYEDGGDFVYAYSNNETVVVFTLLRDAHVRFDTCISGYESDYYDMGSTSSSGRATLTDALTGEELRVSYASSSYNNASCSLGEQMLEAGTYRMTFSFDAGSSCDCSSSSEIQISLEARPVPSMTIYEVGTVLVQQDFVGSLPADAQEIEETVVTADYADLPEFLSRSFTGDEDGSCSAMNSSNNRARTRTWGIANGNVILLQTVASTRTQPDTSQSLCYSEWNADIVFDFDFEVLRASSVVVEACHASVQSAYPGEDPTDSDGGFTEIRVWDPATEQSEYYAYSTEEGTQCETVEFVLQPGIHRLWADSHAWSTGKRGHETTARLELTFHDLADLDKDGRVNGADLAILLGSWGACADCRADVNGDGSVGGEDLSLILGGWTS